METNQSVPYQMFFAELFDLYQRRHAATRLKCPANVKYWGTVHLARWANIPVDQIKQTDIQQWVDLLGEKSPSAANRAVHQLAAIIHWGMKRGFIELPGDRNPCKWVEKFRQRSRDRFLMADEIESFLAALIHESETIRHICLMALLTGARRGNICAMRWAEIDFRLKMWRIPAEKFKNGDPHTIPLSDAAISILQDRKAVSESEWVFPGKGAKGHIVEIKKAWARITERAGLNDLRFHDLRRTVGSYLAIEGYSTYIIGRVLGHKDQRSTAVYARLDLNPVRRGLSHIEAVLGQNISLHTAVPIDVEVLSEPPPHSDTVLHEPARPVLLRLYRASMPERRCGRSKNADVILGPEAQAKVEAIILRCLSKGPCRRSAFHDALGGKYRVNGAELFRLLCEMEERGLIESFLYRDRKPRARSRMLYQLTGNELPLISKTDSQEGVAQ